MEQLKAIPGVYLVPYNIAVVIAFDLSFYDYRHPRVAVSIGWIINSDTILL